MFGFGRRKSVEEMAAAAASAGIALRPGMRLEAAIGTSRASMEKGGFKLFLASLGGEQVEHGTFNLLGPLSDDIWHFDLEAIEDHGDYVYIVDNCCRLTGGDLVFDAVKDFVDVEKGIAWIELTKGGKTGRINLTVDNDWADPDVFQVLANRLAATGSLRRYAFFALGQDMLIICKTPTQIQAINRLTGLRFE
jgi:hypothetical protein